MQPASGSQVTGPLDIAGVADGAGFAGYQLDFAVGLIPGQSDWMPLGLASTTPVTGDLLATWNTAGLAPGPYTLRLRVYDTVGGYAESFVAVELVTP